MNTLFRTITFVCLLIAACCLTAADAFAQTKISTPADLYKNSGNYLEGTSTDNGTTVFCAEGTGFTLVSSTTDPENNLPYTSYTWQEMNEDGTTYTTLPPGADPNKTTITSANATPGWHIYRVTAVTGNAGCEPDPTYFTVYVLPKLKVDPRANKTEAEGISYCSETGAPAAPNAFIFSGNISFDGTPRMIQHTQLPPLEIDDFELQIAWTKVITGSGARSVVANTENYTIADATLPAAAESYTLELEVKYAIVPAKGACNPVLAVAKYNGSTVDATVKVYKKAGRPTITIE
ncbi:hypothetical protein WJU16_20815 [Chitinophaga pollutisoli]|uniref:Uncharacterized protein n=1 Tax=Chitinophaga pollutisoli TaxID=3133966 RepID=A0ABZ2YLP7_9BACT